VSREGEAGSVHELSYVELQSEIALQSRVFRKMGLLEEQGLVRYLFDLGMDVDMGMDELHSDRRLMRAF
jgi:hypothetical protein